MPEFRAGWGAWKCSHGSDPPAQVCHLPGAEATALAQGLSLKESVIPAGVIRTGTAHHPNPAQCPVETPAQKGPSALADEHEASRCLSLPDRQVSPQQQDGPQGGLRLPGECDRPQKSGRC